MENSKHLYIKSKISSKIITIRGQKVILAHDLAAFYDVETKKLNQAVTRNITRFPGDFMFQLTWEELEELSRSQFVTLKRGQNMKYLPRAFTEHGVVASAFVLKSKKAEQVSIEIIREFKLLRDTLREWQGIDISELFRKMATMETKHANQIGIILDAIGEIMADEQITTSKNTLGFIKPKKQTGSE